MNRGWNGRDCWNDSRSHQNNFPYYDRGTNENVNTSRFLQDRSRSRAPSYTATSHFGENTFFNDNRNYRNRRNNRRSFSAPRSVGEENKNWYQTSRPSRRVTYLPSNYNNDQSFCNDNAKKSEHFQRSPTPKKSEECQRSQNQMNKFRAIFVKDNESSSAPMETETVSNSPSSQVQNTNIVSKQLDNHQSFCNDNAKDFQRSPTPKEYKDSQRSQNQAIKFKSIFDNDNVASSAPIETGTVSNSASLLVQNTNIVSNQLDHSVKYKEKDDSPDEILKNLDAEEDNRTHSTLETDKDKAALKPSQEVQGKDHMVKYYGASLTEMKNKDLQLCNIDLPIVDWPKEPSTIDNLPEYDSRRCVGGDGLTLELFYLCKYCKMFTGGCQIDAHLKSRYHYDHYKEFLKTNNIATTSTISDSECDSKISISPKKQIEDRPAKLTSMDIDDSYIVLNCHQELDYEED